MIDLESRPEDIAGTRAAVRAAIFRSVPCGVETVVLVRGPIPRTIWQKLWNKLGLWLAQKAGFEVIQ